MSVRVSVTSRINMWLVSESFNPRLNDSCFCKESGNTTAVYRLRQWRERKRKTDSAGDKEGGFKKVPLSSTSPTLNDLDMSAKWSLPFGQSC